MPHRRAVHFVSGLPRAGSTLLSALLSQNPALVTSGRSSPVAPMMLRVASLMAEGDYASDFDAARRDRILHRILDGYYAGLDQPGSSRANSLHANVLHADTCDESHSPRHNSSSCANGHGDNGHGDNRDRDNRIVIDTHRDWCARMGLIDAVFPDAKVICCVRDPVWILDSLERLIVRDPVLSSRLVPLSCRATQHDRIEHMLSQDGVFGYAWRVLNEAFHGPFAHRLILVDYDYLARYPVATLDTLTRVLGLPKHPYDPHSIKTPDCATFDRNLATPELHRLRPSVALETRRSILPPAIRDKLAGTAFWRFSQATESDALVLC